VLKKTQSDKYLIKPPAPPKRDKPVNVTNPAPEGKEEKLIHKFVTQVTRSETNTYKGHCKEKGEKVACYYIENAVDSTHKNYLLPFR
jgi:hypothetical protein